MLTSLVLFPYLKKKGRSGSARGLRKRCRSIIGGRSFDSFAPVASISVCIYDSEQRVWTVTRFSAARASVLRVLKPRSTPLHRCTLHRHSIKCSPSYSPCRRLPSSVHRAHGFIALAPLVAPLAGHGDRPLLESVTDSIATQEVPDSVALDSEMVPDSVATDSEMVPETLPPGAFLCPRCHRVHENRESWDRVHSLFWPCSRCGKYTREVYALRLHDEAPR